MELNHLKYFYEIARQGSFTKASRFLRVSQPSLSKTVRLLEEGEGVRLFDRNRKGVKLTHLGKVYYESCEKIFSELGNLNRAVENLKDDCTGELSIGASDNLCNYLLPSLLQDFTKTHPKVHIKLGSGVAEFIRNELFWELIELGLFYTPLRERDLICEKVGFVEFWIVYAPKFDGKSKAKFLTVKDLPKHGYVGSRSADYKLPAPCNRMLDSIGVVPNIVFETNNQETQKRMAMQGYGYTVVPRHMVEAEVQRGLLRTVLTPKKLGWDLLLLTKRGRTLSKPAAVFREYLKGSLSKALERQQ
jgi:DNA-binding transcriptional LysR family regulator